MENSLKQKSFIVFVTKFLSTKGIYKDEVIQVSEDRFKSIKFRHTSYKADDFNTNVDTILLYEKRK